MSGQVPPSSRAGKSRRQIRSEADRAADLVERFKGHDAEVLGKVTLPPIPSHLAVIGELDGVLYTTQRDGVIEKYIHKFAAGDKPLLCVAPDGSQLHLVGGRYVFTERGIVDLSDRKNLPKGYRRK
jgi:hypothetical protein